MLAGSECWWACLLQLDVILARYQVSVTAALQGETRAIPIVIRERRRSLGRGLHLHLARPGGNLTGFMTFEAGISGKWVTMLKEVMPGLTGAMFVANPKTTTYSYYLAEAEAAARAHALELVPAAIESWLLDGKFRGFCTPDQLVNRRGRGARVVPRCPASLPSSR